MMSRDDLYALGPWPRPKSAYDDDGPISTVQLAVSGVQFRVVPSGIRGLNSGRMRFMIECLSCPKLVHRATTSAVAQIDTHLREQHTKS